MGKYDLKDFYEENDIDEPKSVGVGDCIWTILEGGKDGKVWCLNPTNWGQDRLIIRERPKSISDRHVLDEHNWLNPDLEGEPVHVKILEKSSGTIYGKILPEKNWPAPDTSVVFTLDRTRTKRGTVTNNEDRGTGQSVSSVEADRRRKVQKEGDIRGSKNDLVK